MAKSNQIVLIPIIAHNFVFDNEKRSIFVALPYLFYLIFSDMQIHFFQEDAHFPTALRKTSFRSVVQIIVQGESKKKIDYINFIACSDEYLLAVNQNYLNHDYYTDVITFDYSETEIASDIFLSMDRIEDNARQNKVSKMNECYRILIHGVLHLVGYKDKTPEDKKVMTEKEDYYLRLIV